MDYYKALQRRKKVTAIPPGATRASVSEAIESMTAELRGPMSNAERIMLVHDRDDARDVLALIDARDGTSHG